MQAWLTLPLSLIARYDTRCFLYIVTLSGLNAFTAQLTATRFLLQIIHAFHIKQIIIASPMKL